MLYSASKEISIKISGECIKIINNKEILDGLIGNTKMQKKESLFKYHHVYTMFKGALMLITEV